MVHEHLSNSLFSSKEYVLYRFEYPEILFHSLRSSSADHEKPLQVLDLGCGTGLVAESFLKSYSAPVEMHLVDPDSEMLQEAQKQLSKYSSVRSWKCASSEKIPFPNSSFDLILIGSAWHWMSPDRSLEEIHRVLKPGGCVFIFEYQFPKCVEYSELNNWIRNRFNTVWKPATQTPRGSLKEITECWRQHFQFSQLYSGVVVQHRTHDSSELGGVILSQSRYQHYEQAFPKSEHTRLREQLERDLNHFLNGNSGKFTYLYEGFLFKKRV